MHWTCSSFPRHAHARAVHVHACMCMCKATGQALRHGAHRVGVWAAVGMCTHVVVDRGSASCYTAASPCLCHLEELSHTPGPWSWLVRRGPGRSPIGSSGRHTRLRCDDGSTLNSPTPNNLTE